MVTFVPADVQKRKYNLRWDIGSRSADPEYRLIYTKNIYMNIDLSFEQHSLKLHMRSRTGRVLKGLIIIHRYPNCTLVLFALVVALTTKATSYDQ